MKTIGIYLILIFLLVRDIYSQSPSSTKFLPSQENIQPIKPKRSIKICLLERFGGYVTMFREAYNKIDPSVNLEFEFIMQSITNYLSSVSTYNCDITMIEPPIYDKNYNNTLDISNMIQDTIIKRTSDPEDGEMYQELLNDLKNSNEDNDNKIKALPLFMDYGILYYRADLVDNPPKTWTELIESYPDEIDFSNSELYYLGQFNTVEEFYYNLVENIISTDNGRGYKYVEKQTKKTLEKFKEAIDNEKSGSDIWSVNSNFASQRFYSLDKPIHIMRNWSSYLHNITKEFSDDKLVQNGMRFKITNILYLDEFKRTRAVNKGIYLCVTTNDQDRIEEIVDSLILLTSREFMENLMEDVAFYEIPPYKSLISEDNSINNADYCKRIDCDFFRDIQKDHIVAAYDVFYQHHFTKKFDEFYDKFKTYLKGGKETSNNEGYVSLDTLMSYFSNYFQDKYIEFGSTTSIIIIIVIIIEILITAVVAFNIIKYRNFIEIRRSSPLFLILMLLGIILAFSSILTFIGQPTNIICKIRPYIFILAFGLTFYSLLLKTFRIKVIFDKINIQVKDSYLILYLCIILGIELGLVTVWTVFGSMISDVREINDEIHYYDCQNVNKLGQSIQTILIIINAIALLYGCYLAYKVKNVYSEYNESKIIGLSIYGIVICMIILFFIVSIDGLDINTIFLIESLMIILSANIILIFMFTPKLWKLHVNNMSERVYDKPVYIY